MQRLMVADVGMGYGMNLVACWEGVESFGLLRLRGLRHPGCADVGEAADQHSAAGTRKP